MDEKKNLIKRARDWLTPGDNEVPLCVKEQCKRHYLIAGAFILFGVAAGFGVRDIMVFVVSLILALAVGGMGYMKELSVSKKGYLMVKGVCEKVEYSRLTKDSFGRLSPSRFLVRNELFDNDIYAIPCYKQNATIDEGDIVAVYYPKNVRFISVRGAKASDNILGYELLGQEETPEA